MGRFALLASSTLFIGLSKPEGLNAGWPILGYSLLILDLLLNRKQKHTVALSAGLLSQSMAWIVFGNWLMGCILVALYALHRMAIRKNTMKFDPSGISLSFPWPRHLPWASVDFVMLKDGLLTLEYQGRNVFQQLIDKDPSLRESDFNEFCQQQCKP